MNLNDIAAVPLMLVDAGHLQGLCARHLARRERSEEIKKRGPQSVARAANANKTGGYGYSVDSAGVAMIQINGVITPETFAFYDDDETISDWLTRDVAALANDPSCRGVMVNINSPGGYVSGSFLLSDEFVALAQAKPTCTFVGDLCCSAAYLQASQTSRITAYRTATVGSIGTRSMLIDAKDFFAKMGIKIIPIDSGGMKSAGLIGTEITQPQVDYFKGIINDLQAHFTAAVARGRGMSMDAAQQLADGKVHIAPAAQSIGLIDAIGDAQSARADLMSRIQSGTVASATRSAPSSIMAPRPSAQSFADRVRGKTRLGLERGRAIQSARSEDREAHRQWAAAGGVI